MVFYRKYRPQLLFELDSALVRETLLKVLKNPPHAFLFTGPKGLGKTSAARIVAKVVNCTGRGESIEPCNKCEECISITNGTNLDVLEIDAASNRGIDEIRELKDKIRLAPLSASKKIYIIDEVHMLTTEAFNALLKTLEEPPSHAMFVLCTTEEQKIPSTILSRCFHVAFKPANKEELARSLRRIMVGENLEIDDDAMTVIADLSDSGFRDGAKIMEELSALFAGQNITKEIVEKQYKTTGVLQEVNKMADYLVKKDAKSALMIISNLSENGSNLQYFTEELIAVFHTGLLKKVGVKINSPLRISFRSSFAGQAELEVGEIKELLLLLTKAYSEMKSSIISQFPLEIAIIEWCTMNNNSESRIQSSESSALQSGEKESTEKSYIKTDQEVSVSSLRKHVGNIKKIKALYGEDEKDSEPKKIVSEGADIEIMNYSADGEITKEWIDVLWKNIIHQMKNHNHTIAGVLRGCVIKSFDRKNLIIEAGYKFHKDKLIEGKTREALESVCHELVGKPVSVEIVLKS